MSALSVPVASTLSIVFYTPISRLDESIGIGVTSIHHVDSCCDTRDYVDSWNGDGKHDGWPVAHFFGRGHRCRHSDLDSWSPSRLVDEFRQKKLGRVIRNWPSNIDSQN